MCHLTRSPIRIIFKCICLRQIISTATEIDIQIIIIVIICCCRQLESIRLRNFQDMMLVPQTTATAHTTLMVRIGLVVVVGLTLVVIATVHT